MTTLQLAQRLTRNLTHTDVKTLVPEQQQLVVDAINTGLAEYVELLPEIRRAEPRLASLLSPASYSLTCTNGSPTVAFDDFPQQQAHLGKTVQVGSDSGRYQRLVALNTLLGNHNGPTGATSLTVYSDSVQFGRYDDSISGKLVLQEGNTRHNMISGRPLEWFSLQPSALELGLPRYWWMEALSGMTGLDSPLFVLRVWPVPATAYDLLYSLRLFPQAVTMVDLVTPRTLPVLPIEEAHLVNICMPGMLTSKLWSGDVDKKAVREDYNRAIEAMKPKLERSGSNEPNLVHTPFGW